MNEQFPGYGGKRPLLYKSYGKLSLDPLNPRLPKEIQGKDEQTIKDFLRKSFFLEELATSMAENGYFDEEPLVAIPKNLPEAFKGLSYDQIKANKEYLDFLDDPNTEFIVVEGNRRLCTVKLLLSNEVQSFPTISENIRTDLERLPVIVYPERKDVISYIGVRHIIGVKKWDAYAKARYIALMVEDYQMPIDEIQSIVGDTSNSARKTYACYRLIEIVKQENESYDLSKATENFSYLMLALGQGTIKEFLGLPKTWSAIDFESPVNPDKIENLLYLFSWLFGEGKERSKVINESRDITGKLTTVLKDTNATNYLKEFRNLDEAFDRSGGEALLLGKYLKRAHRTLSQCLPFLPRYYNEEIEELIKNVESSVESINKLKK